MQDQTPPGNNTYIILVVILLSTNFGVVFLDRNALNYLMPFVAPDLRLDDRQIGLLAGATAVSWAISGLVLSAISDRLGRRKSILVGATVVFSLLSVASGFAGSFGALLLIRLAMGAAEGPVLPISQAIIAAEASPARRGLFMGIMNNAGSNLIGVMIAPPLLVGIAAATGWRTGFQLAGLPGLVMALLIWLLVKEPRHALVEIESDPAQDWDTQDWDTQDLVAQNLLTQDWRALLRSRNVMLCAAIACCMLGWTLLGWVFLPLFFVRELHFAPAMMGLLMSTLGASAVVGCILVPGLSDRIGRKPAIVLFAALGVVPPLAVGYAGLGATALALTIFAGWLASGTLPLFMATIPSETVSRTQLATAMALVMGVGEIVGGAVMPVVAGMLADRHGLIAVLLVQAGLAALAAVLSLFLVETAPARRSAHAI